MSTAPDRKTQPVAMVPRWRKKDMPGRTGVLYFAHDPRCIDVPKHDEVLIVEAEYAWELPDLVEVYPAQVQVQTCCQMFNLQGRASGSAKKANKRASTPDEMRKVRRARQARIEHVAQQDSERRPTMSHADCKHEKTAAARKVCRAQRERNV